MKNKRNVYAIDGFLIVGTVVSLFLIISPLGFNLTGMVVGPVLEYPEDGFVSSRSILFSFKHGHTLLIDDNLNFRSPKRFDVKDDLRITLEPGVYYWMVEGSRESEIRQFTIESRIELKLRETDSEYEVINAGNVKLNVRIYEKGEFIETIILDVDSLKEIEKISETKIIGGQYE